VPTVAMAKGDREAFRAALKVLGNEESDKKGKVADRKPKPAKRAIVDKDGKGQKASGKAGDEPGKSSAPKRSWKGRERRMPKRKPSSKNSTAKFPVANENDGNWRKAPKSALADRLERFVKHASEMLALEREAEACTAANLLLQEQSEYPSCPVVLPGAENTPEGTSVGRAGALMEGLMLVGAAPGPEGAGTRLLNFRPAAGGALPPSAINVGDRVAIAVTGVLDYTDLYDESPAGYEVEGVIQSLEPTRNEVNLVVDGGSVNQRRLLSKGSFVIVDELLAGKILRFVRVPDAVTYERQLAALKKLANVPNSRTGPPAMDIVRALFAQQRCPKDSTDASDPASRDDSPRTDGYDKGVGFFADAPEVATPKAARIVSADDLAPLDTRPVAKGGGGPIPVDFDPAQQLAVRIALTKTAPVVWIQGPPGTGKTGVVIEIIRRAVASGQRVLACAPSNAAVDNLVERLAKLNTANELDAGNVIDFVRIGAPERISSAALESSLDARIDRETGVFFDASRGRKKEIDLAKRQGWKKQEELQKGKVKGLGDNISAKNIETKLGNLRREQRTLAKSGKKVRANAEREILAEVQVVLATAVGAGAENIQRLPAFDIVILDEAAQATEPAAWIPMVRSKRAVLVGDPCQLAPLVRSTEASDGGLATPLMARVSQNIPEKVNSQKAPALGAANAYLSSGVLGCVLTTQYRSNQLISDWASQEMYGGRLAASERVASRLLSQMPGVASTPATNAPLLLLDTRTRAGMLLTGCSEVSESEMAARERSRNIFSTSRDEDDGNLPVSSSSSLVNEGEAYAVMMHVAGLLGAGLAPSDIAVQSPYAAQVRLIRTKLADVAARGAAPGADLVEVASVDSFQGREAEAVVISTVRSNDKQSVGFLADVRRANVAVTRARRHVCIVGDSVTVGGDPFLNRLMSHMRTNGLVATANEFGELHQRTP
jgi:hypothetical protein